MAVRDVVLYPDGPLTEKSAAVEQFDSALHALVRDLFDTMEAHEGVGLAAPQVGVKQRVLVLRIPDGEEMCLVNPEIIRSEGREEGREGCLSLPEMYYDNVPRATRIQVQAQDKKGEPLEFEARDFLARVIQHEVDHLDGIMCIDRLDILSRQAAIQEWEHVRAARETVGP